MAFSVHLCTWPNRPLQTHDDPAGSEPQRLTPHMVRQPHPGPWAFWSFLCSTHTPRLTLHPRGITVIPPTALGFPEPGEELLHLSCTPGVPPHPHPPGPSCTLEDITLHPCCLSCHLQHRGPILTPCGAPLHPTLPHCMGPPHPADISLPTFVSSLSRCAGDPTPGRGSREPSSSTHPAQLPSVSPPPPSRQKARLPSQDFVLAHCVAR